MISPFARQSIVITRTFPTVPEHLFDAWTKPHLIQQWWGPKGFSCPVCEIDFRVGGGYLLCVSSPSGQKFWSKGFYQEIQPYERIIVMDSFSDQHGNIRSAASVGLPGSWPSTLQIIVQFQSVKDTTEFQLQHQGLPVELVPSCEVGWNESLDKLEQYVLRMNNPPRRH